MQKKSAETSTNKIMSHISLLKYLHISSLFSTSLTKTSNITLVWLSSIVSKASNLSLDKVWLYNILDVCSISNQYLY